MQKGFLRFEHVDEASTNSLRREALPVQALPPQVLAVWEPQPTHEDPCPERPLRNYPRALGKTQNKSQFLRNPTKDNN